MASALCRQLLAGFAEDLRRATEGPLSLQRVWDEAAALQHEGKHEEAIKQLDAALQIIRDSGIEAEAPETKAAVLTVRAACLYMSGRREAAIADAKLSVRLNPCSPPSHQQLADLLGHLDQDEAACLALLRGFKTVPEHSAHMVERILGYNTLAKAFSDAEIAESLASAGVGPIAACAVCKKVAVVLKCSKCCEVWYCCKEHQRADWRRHKRACAAFADLHATNKPRRVAAVLNSPPDLEAVYKSRFGSRWPRRPPSLHDLPTWDAVYEYIPFNIVQPRVMSEFSLQELSYPLTIAAALVAFELEGRAEVCVHLINGNLNSVLAFDHTRSAIRQHLPFPKMQLVFCGLSAELAEPQPLHHIHWTHEQSRSTQLAELSKHMSGLNPVTLSSHWALWHESAADLPPPDLVIGFDTDLHDIAYEWPATLRALVARNVPCVFTAASEREYERALTAVRAARGNLAFHGPGRFPSPRAVSKLGELQHRNSFWLGFCGGCG